MAIEDMDLKPTSIAARDLAEQSKAADDPAKVLHDAVAASTRTPDQMMAEVMSVAKSPGKLSKDEYVRYRMYELDKDERGEFISDRLHWPIHDLCNDPDEAGLTTDKWGCTQHLLGLGIPTIPVLAVVDHAGGTYGDTPVATDGTDLAALLSTATFPLFAKPNELLGSFGALRIDGIEGEKVTITDGVQVLADDLVTDLIGDVPYVLQPLIENHSTIRAFAPALATIRTMNFVTNGDVRMHAAIYKLPAAGNIADNFWREGNLVAEIDPASGVVVRVVSEIGPYQQEHAEHPQTGDQLVGLQLPDWDQVKALNEQVARCFPALRYQTQDIALTDEGPINVEVNSGGSFDLPQVATGRGLLTKENRKFFEKCGVNFRKFKAKDLGLV